MGEELREEWPLELVDRDDCLIQLARLVQHLQVERVQQRDGRLSVRRVDDLWLLLLRRGDGEEGAQPRAREPLRDGVRATEQREHAAMHRRRVRRVAAAEGDEEIPGFEREVFFCVDTYQYNFSVGQDRSDITYGFERLRRSEETCKVEHRAPPRLDDGDHAECWRPLEELQNIVVERVFCGGAPGHGTVTARPQARERANPPIPNVPNFRAVVAPQTRRREGPVVAWERREALRRIAHM